MLDEILHDAPIILGSKRSQNCLPPSIRNTNPNVFNEPHKFCFCRFLFFSFRFHIVFVYVVNFVKKESLWLKRALEATKIKNYFTGGQ